MIKIKSNLSQILTMNSLNVKHQGKNCNQLVLHALMKTCQLTHIYEDFKKRYFRSIQSTSWLFVNSESASYDKNDMKEKVNDLVRFHKAMQEKLKTASYSEQIQIFTLLPDKWSTMYCAEYFNVFEYQTSRWNISKTCP